MGKSAQNSDEVVHWLRRMHPTCTLHLSEMLLHELVSEPITPHPAAEGASDRTLDPGGALTWRGDRILEPGGALTRRGDRIAIRLDVLKEQRGDLASTNLFNAAQNLKEIAKKRLPRKGVKHTAQRGRNPFAVASRTYSSHSHGYCGTP